MEFSENLAKYSLIIIMIVLLVLLLKHLFLNTEPSPMAYYLQENYLKIISIITLFMIVIVIFKILKVDFTKDETTTLTDQYVVENFKSDLLPESFWRTKGQGFCQAITNNIDKHKKACSKLSFSNCSQFTNCCAAVNGFDENSYDCVPTSSSGRPIFSKDNYGQNIDFYFYKGKCSGRGCDLNMDQRKKLKEKRSTVIKNVEEKQEILNKVEEEKEKEKKSGCESQEKTCYLWGVPDAQISPFG